jgi:RNA polymerase sigma-70 factor (ECF subfamily)
MARVGSICQSYESELVEKLRSGDCVAMAEFYTTYRSRLYTLIVGQVGRDQAVAEDLVQEVFLAAMGSLDKFRGDSQLYTWLRSIALHKINDFYRQQAKEPKLRQSSPEFNAMELEQTWEDIPEIFSMAESEEIRQSVHQALVGLPQDYQEVLVLKYIKEMPVLAISQVMGRSPKSVEALLSRARKAMRANLGKNGWEYQL